MKRVFYSDSLKHEIVDLNGTMQSPGDEYQMVEIDDGEVAYFDGGVLKKKNLQAEVDAGKDTRKAKRDADLALMGWDKQKLKAVKRLINSDEGE